MKKNLFRLASVLAFFVFFSGTTIPVSPVARVDVPIVKNRLAVEDDEYIPWTSSRPLSWGDFQCPPKPKGDAVASTSTSLGIAYQMENGKLDYQITCSFSKIKSWGLLRTNYILAHEQGHFDITEIYARKLHQALQEYKFNRRHYKSDVGKIYERIVKEKEAFQEAYDGETDHSREKKI